MTMMTRPRLVSLLDRTPLCPPGFWCQRSGSRLQPSRVALPLCSSLASAISRRPSPCPRPVRTICRPSVLPGATFRSWCRIFSNVPRGAPSNPSPRPRSYPYSWSVRCVTFNQKSTNHCSLVLKTTEHDTLRLSRLTGVTAFLIGFPGNRLIS